MITIHKITHGRDRELDLTVEAGQVSPSVMLRQEEDIIVLDSKMQNELRKLLFGIFESLPKMEPVAADELVGWDGDVKLTRSTPDLPDRFAGLLAIKKEVETLTALLGKNK